uniref:Uncharacterized protein n=1 Tax=Rhizophagus irregularis (strain DAOM 181602 / DAOM 197198 / MUCL 43194) TaxID=747089 RepID=U9UT91_RHIID
MACSHEFRFVEFLGCAELTSLCFCFCFRRFFGFLDTREIRNPVSLQNPGQVSFLHR